MLQGFPHGLVFLMVTLKEIYFDLSYGVTTESNTRIESVAVITFLTYP